MANHEPGHPDRELLAAFVQGRLDPDREAELEAHVTECDSCCEQIQAVPDDPFVALLRAAGVPPAPSETPESLRPFLGVTQELGPVGFAVPSSFVGKAAPDG